MFLAESKLRNLIRSVVYESLLKENSDNLKLVGGEVSVQFAKILNDIENTSEKDIFSVYYNLYRNFNESYRKDIITIANKIPDQINFKLDAVQNKLIDYLTRRGKETQLKELANFTKELHTIVSGNKVSHLFEKLGEYQQLLMKKLDEINQKAGNISLFTGNIIKILEACKKKNKIWQPSIIDKEIAIVKGLTYEEILGIANAYSGDWGKDNAKLFKKNYCTEILFTNLFGTNITKDGRIPIVALCNGNIKDEELEKIVTRIVRTVFQRNKGKEGAIKKDQKNTEDLNKTIDQMNRESDMRNKPAAAGNIAKGPIK